MHLFHIALYTTFLGASVSVACALTYVIMLLWRPKAEIALPRLAKGITYGFIVLAIAAMLYTIDALNRAPVY